MAGGGQDRPAADALDAWVLATLPRALAFAASLLKDLNAADDVVHDCYCRILEKAGVYDIPRDGTKILFKAITNACIDRNALRNEAAGQPGDWPDRKALEPVAEAIGLELEAAVAAGLGRLPMAQRAALELRSLGHSQHEIAEALGVSVSHAGVLIHRARQTLARELGGLVEGELE